MSKICSKCKIEKNDDEFYSNKRCKDGLDYYCKDCRKLGLGQSNQNSYERNRWFVDNLKSECIKCGETRPWVIQFHHVNPKNKVFSISQCGTRARDMLWKEASKCVCLCANCHDEFHYFFGGNPSDPVAALNDYLEDNY